MTTDFCGSPVTLRDPEALDAWNRLQRAFLAHGADTPVHLARTLELAPGFAMAHAVKGLFMLMLGRRELVATAQEALATARKEMAAEPGTAREQGFVAALADWLDGKPAAAAARVEAGLADHPGDALAVKIGHSIRFILGDAVGMKRTLDAVVPAYPEGHPARGYILGCRAFAEEEMGAYGWAETAGREGMRLCPDDAWGLHAVAHVHDMTGRAEDGLIWLDRHEARWAHCNNFRYHVWWHKALMHLELGQNERVFDLYDTKVRAERTDDFRDISNAASLLCRMELNGLDIGDRWDELAALSADRTEDGCLIFADLHYLLALIGGDRREAQADLMGRIRRDAAVAGSEMTQRMARPGLSAAQGLEAFGRGSYAEAFVNLSAARPAMPLAGGSHAQRDVFERLTIDAGLRAGFHDEAGALLEDRRMRRGGHEDGYFASRRTLIAEAAGLAQAASPAAGRRPA